MSTLAKARYLAQVQVAGAAFLAFDRWNTERKLAGARPSELFGPPLRSSARLKELISRHYLVGRYANGVRPVAWVTSGGPVELLVALGYHVHYPENHGAVCGIRRAAEGACVRAEEEGWSRDICSYARTDFGTVLSGKTPVGRLPRPDLLLCCTNICQTVLYWYQWLASHYRVPLVLVDTPFLYRDAPDHAVEYVRRQLDAAIPVAERVAGRTLSDARLREVTAHAREGANLWMEVLATAKAKPAPFTAFDAFIHLAPIVEMRGEPWTVDYYRGLLAELRERVDRGIGAVRTERRRVVWDNLPVWARVRWLSALLARGGVSMVASTYTQAWGELAPMIDPERPLESAARVYLHPVLNRGTGHKLQVLETMVRDYGAHGVILHSDRSCKPYSIGQGDQRERLSRSLSVPALLLDADHNDPRAFSEEQATARVEAFLETLP